MLNKVVLPKSIEEICEARAQVINKIESAHRLLRDARKILDEVVTYAWPHNAEPKLSINESVSHIDDRLWRYAFEKTGLTQYMDAQAISEFERSLEKEIPPFTVDSVKTSLLSTAQDADKMFIRGMVEFFRRLSDEHKTNTNEPFKVGRRAVMRYVTSPWMGLTLAYNERRNVINDMDRVFKTLDGKQHRPRELECSVNESWKQSNIHEDEYFQIKGFKNGNAHILFKRDDLLEKANDLIAEYYGDNALAQGAA